MNITESIWRNCRAYPDRVALIVEGQEISYRELLQLVLIASGHLAAAGVGKGDRLAVGVSSPLGRLVIALALARMGAIGSPYRSDWLPAQKRAVLRRHQISCLLLEPEQSYDDQASYPLRVLSTENLLRIPQAQEKLAIPPMSIDADDREWWIWLSSGTTGVPKSIPETHAEGLMSITLNTLGGKTTGQRVLVFVDLSTQMGMSATMRSLFMANTVVLTRNASPANFFALVERDKPNRVVTSTGLATGLPQYAQDNLPDSRQLCQSLHTIQLAGSVLPPAVRRGLDQTIGARIEVNYGSSESGGLAEITPEIARQYPDAHGRLFPWVEAVAFSDEGQPLPQGEVGLLRFHTPALVKGYLDDEVATRKAFVGGWYCPGDRGSVDGSGLLRLVGRDSHVINIGGRKINAEMIEDVLNSDPSVLESAVVAVNEDEATLPVLVAVLVPGRSGAWDREQLRKRCAEQLGHGYVPKYFVEAGALPRNVGGKIDREQVVKRVAIRG